MVNSSVAPATTSAAVDAYFGIFRNSPFGIYLVDADFCLVEASKGCSKVFQGIDPLLGRDFAEILSLIWQEPFASECIDHFRRTLETGEPYEAADTSKPRGNVDDLESYDWRIERVTLQDGEHAVVCYFYDLSDRVRLQEALRDSEHQLQEALITVKASDEFNRSVLESSPDCVKILDAEGRLQYVNENGVCLLELDAASDVLGNFWWTLWNEDMQDAIKDAVSRALGGEDSHFQAFSPTAKGTPKWWDVIVSRVPHAEGESPRIISVSRDVTESKQAEEAIKLVRDQLEIKVDERTAELQEAHADLGRLLKEVVAVQENERQRISRDVHDHLGGTLTGLRLNLESLLEESHGRPRLADKIGKIQKIAGKLDSDISYLAWMLRPAILDDLGLVPALDCFVDEWSERFGIEAEFKAVNVDDEGVDRDVETNLYRITQEALTNTAKHAAATSANVILEQKSGVLKLIIEDNGKGFSHPSGEKSGDDDQSMHGLGLGGMRDRARLVGASFEMESSEGGGTSIFIAVPIG